MARALPLPVMACGPINNTNQTNRDANDLLQRQSLARQKEMSKHRRHQGAAGLDERGGATIHMQQCKGHKAVGNPTVERAQSRPISPFAAFREDRLAKHGNNDSQKRQGAQSPQRRRDERVQSIANQLHEQETIAPEE
jgi:hypothetical protein